MMFANQHSTNLAKKTPPLLAAVVVLLAGNLACGLWLASRVTRIEQQFGASATNPSSQQASALPDSTFNTHPARVGTSSSPIQSLGDNATSRLDLKQRDAYVPPEDMARSMDQLLYDQPANPDQEMKQRQWLLEAAQQMTGQDVPKAQAIGSTCQGSRCVVTATFVDSNTAESWATRYLLTAGGKLLSKSRTVVLPAPNGSAVTLQLYLY